MRATEKVFDQTQLLQAACDTSIARVTGCVHYHFNVLRNLCTCGPQKCVKKL